MRSVFGAPDFGVALLPPALASSQPSRRIAFSGKGQYDSSEGHVIQFRQRLDLDRGPEIRFESVGVNQATVFTGLCARHDSLLFRPLEHEALDLASREQLFLLACAIVRETHVCMEAAVRLQSTYQKQGVRVYADPPAGDVRRAVH